MAQMIVIYKTPRNPAAFEGHYFGVHVPLARQLPVLRKLETNRGPIISLYGASNVYLVATLHSLCDINAAFMFECGRACAADRTFGPYLVIELLLPGGSLVALLLWLYRTYQPTYRRFT